MLVVSPKRRRIVLALVTEPRAKRLEPLAVPHEPIPVVMADLMAEMTE